MEFTMSHENYNVSDIQKSMEFYREALGLEEKHRKSGDGFLLVFLGNKENSFLLELTQLEDHPQKYDLGEGEFHLGLTVKDFEAAKKKHEKMGCICYDNPEMNVYFITDPDGYWIEILPQTGRGSI